MPIRRRHRGADSPFVERITHVAYDGAAGDVTTPDGCWDIVFRRRRGEMQILQTGLITRPIPLDYEPGDEYLSVSFKPGFADQAHLTRSLKTLTGQTPASIRAAQLVAAGLTRDRTTGRGR